MQIQDPWSCYDGWGQWTCYLQLWGTRERRVADLVGPALGGGGLTPGSGTCHRTLTWDSHTCIQQDAAWLARIYGSSKQQAHPCCRRLQCVIVACALRGMT